MNKFAVRVGMVSVSCGLALTLAVEAVPARVAGPGQPQAPIEPAAILPPLPPLARAAPQGAFGRKVTNQGFGRL